MKPLAQQVQQLAARHGAEEAHRVTEQHDVRVRLGRRRQPQRRHHHGQQRLPQQQAQRHAQQRKGDPAQVLRHRRRVP